MSKELSEQEQLEIIKEVEEKYSKFLDPDFDANVFLECRDNFALTSHIESVKIFEMDNPPTNPTFTIAIPTYRRYETLKEAIDSALNQETDERYEIIVVENIDDFNAKTSAQEMLEKEYKGKLTYYKNKSNIGLYENWNRCLTLAKGEWICILHSDDMITDNYIKEMKKTLHLLDNKQVVLLGCLSQNQRKTGLTMFDDCSSHGIFPNPSPNAMLHNKHAALKLGGYNPDEWPISDTFFFNRIREKKGLLILQKHLQIKRIGLNEYRKPKTLLSYCFIGASFVARFYNPRQYASYQAYLYILYYFKLLKDYPEIQNYIQNYILKSPIAKKPNLIIKLFKKISTILTGLFEVYKKKEKIILTKLKQSFFVQEVLRLYLQLLADEQYFIRRHQKMFGYTPNFKNPQTFNEKIVHRILYDRNPIYTLLADKLKARIYITSKLLDPTIPSDQNFLNQTSGSENVLKEDMPIWLPINQIKDLLFDTNLCKHLPKLYGIWDHVEQIDFDSLPNSFVLKTNHDSGGVIVVKDKNKFLTDSQFFKTSMEKLTKHLKTNFYTLYREYHYKDIEPKVFAEELLGNGELFDIRFHQFNGEAKLIQIANSSHTHNDLYSKHWEKLDITYLNPPSTIIHEKPLQLNKMLQLAHQLSKGINYIRIDEFVVDNQVYIGELTLTPNGGTGKFTPSSFDKELGSYLKIH